MKVERISYPGWAHHPTYHVGTFKDWEEICQWMYANKVKHFLVSSGFNGYTFQVRDNHAWFALRWL